MIISEDVVYKNPSFHEENQKHGHLEIKKSLSKMPKRFFENQVYA